MRYFDGSGAFRGGEVPNRIIHKIEFSVSRMGFWGVGSEISLKKKKKNTSRNGHRRIAR